MTEIRPLANGLVDFIIQQGELKRKHEKVPLKKDEVQLMVSQNTIRSRKRIRLKK